MKECLQYAVHIVMNHQKGVNSNLLSLAEKYRWKGEYFPQDEKTRRNFNKSIKS